MSARRAAITRGGWSGCFRTSNRPTPRRSRRCFPTIRTTPTVWQRSSSISAATRRFSPRSRPTPGTRHRSTCRRTPRWSSCADAVLIRTTRSDVMLKLIACCAVVLPVLLAAAGTPVDPQLSVLFGQVGLNDQQRAAIDAGKPVARVLSWGGPSEIYVFGAVHIDGSPATYLKMARNVTRLSGTQGYLGIGELSATATSAELSALTLDADDIKALKACREGDCDVQLPSTSIKAFQESINWSQPDVAGQVNGLARGMVLDLVREYRKGGNDALGVYRDRQNPARVAEQFETMVGRAASLPDVLPQLKQYLLTYPEADLPGSDSFFYWEKVDFGMKPTIRVNHGVIYHTGDPAHGISAVAIKQLYASHYFHTALDVSVCVSDKEKPQRRGFYLLTLKSSEQDGLTGAKGSILRKVAVDKTRSSLEKGLGIIKNAVETASPTRR